MIIDAHNHPDWYGHHAAKFLANMDELGIDRTWLLSWEAPADEYDPAYIKVLPDPAGEGPISFARCAAYVERYPDRFVLGYAPDPRRPDAIDRLRMAIDLYGVRIYGELKLRMMYDNPDALRMFRFCGEAGLPVVVHIDYEFATGRAYPRPNWWYGGGIEAFERAVQACPETIFLGHAPGFWAHISADDQFDKTPYPTGPVVPGGRIERMLRQYPNLYCDISAGSGVNALSRDADYTRSFLIEFQDRVLYGRDYFDNRHQECLESLGLPEEALAKIYSGNALKLVPLDV
ncbi:amidohydrolase family protein [Paenibacillus cymbidii]|uniref:amidohydrolase family protein n=1 Tax=Paenibacillus cymbidii TaxID=1639034 RepID=UPI001081F819|nr:amidohydrolase family protein [Paenibacillus cymbidii]